MRRESHVQFARRAGETGHRKRWNRAPTRPTTLAMLATAILATVALLAPPASDQLIAVTIAEARRLINALILTQPPDPGHVLRWSLWRRRHQKQAQISHYNRRHHLELNR